DAASGRFQHRRLYTRVGKHLASAAWTTAIAMVYAPRTNIHAIRISHAHGLASETKNVSEQSDGGRLSVGAGHGHDRNAAIFSGGEHGADQRLAHITRLSEGRIQMHAQAGRCIDFYYATRLLGQRLEYIGTDEIDAADIEPHHACSRHCHGRD